VIIVNDASERNIADLATGYGVRVVNGNGRGLAAARNVGVQCAKGRLLLFTDADCRVSPRWLETHLQAHERFGEMLMVGGSIAPEPGASLWARCDHYSSWYNVHPAHAPSEVPNHPGANISVSRRTLETVGPFREDLPRSGVHEDIEWQSRLLRSGGRIRFEPRAMIWHVDRSDFQGFMQHNYRWGYNCLLVKGGDRVSRFPWVFRRPGLLIVGFLPFAVVHTIYTIYCWVRFGKLEPLALSPFLFLGRLAYSSGLARGGLRSRREMRTPDSAGEQTAIRQG
jgi:GT2 family glycosyltransferase